ncbi:DUF4349 domain-containing protein [Microbacterium sp. ARD32]|uniref:DUF4349 domain-containing protein n=1 Tax=Microbacterium sp. ARD32 TaxID=2962577 RepID=UPI002881519D|nr:DUF4349 domain-containing protein [Microbacterium sp. ARD32]MDT0157193.1 DUF4349 domain-containing protein [Microbacterium sp. ARD32]
MSSTKKRSSAVVALATLLALLTGCSAGSGAHSGGSVAQNADAAVEQTADGESPDAAVVITGRMSVQTDEPLVAADSAARIVGDAGGRVDGRDEQARSDGQSARAELVLRIPSDSLDRTLDAVRQLGELRESSLQSTPVAAAQRDLEARISSLSTSLSRYNEWLSRAEKTSDLIELEKEISDRQSQLESLEAEQRDLKDQVAMATITAVFEAEYVPVSSAPRSLPEAIGAGWSGFVAFWTGAMIALGLMLPWLALIGLIVVVVLWLVRRARRTSQPGDPGPPPAAAPAAAPPATAAPAATPPASKPE